MTILYYLSFSVRAWQVVLMLDQVTSSAVLALSVLAHLASMPVAETL